MAKNQYRDKVYTINDQPVHVVEAGRAGRQVALLIHGWSSSWYALSPLINLIAQRFHVVAIDLPGYGESPPLVQRTTIPRYAQLIADLIEQISDTPVVLVGHSMGGMTSITLALKRPELVERMVLLNPTITGRLSLFINLFVSPITFLERFKWGSFLVSIGERTIVGITDRLTRPASFAERSLITRQDYEHIRSDIRRPGQGRVRAECFQAMLANDLSARLKKVKTPALVIWGAEDNTVPLRDAGVLADEWPDADLRIIPKTGHWPQFEAPEITSRQIASYLGLPRSETGFYIEIDEDELIRVDEVAQFLTLSDIGADMNLAQRTRLAAQFEQRHYSPGETITHVGEVGNEFFVIQHGTIEIWREPEGGNEEHEEGTLVHVATFRSGQITGELAMLDQNERSADLRAGEEGATVLILSRERLLALGEDDAVLGTRVLWNIAKVVSGRVRFILWQLNRAEQRHMAEIAQSQD